jgi:PTH1 family peptidyl-tRNA hydrolase
MSLTSLLGGVLPFKVDRLIVGLGNPGADYEETPHNIGFQVLDALAHAWGVKFKVHKKLQAQVGVGRFNGEQILLIKPLTYMNLSGNAVAPLMTVYDLPTSHLLVLVDEINLAFGSLRVRPKGSAGGQNGMKHIIQSLGNQQDFARLRLGIGPQPEGVALEDFVLKPYTPQQREQLPKICETAVACVESLLAMGVTTTQNLFNR